MTARVVFHLGDCKTGSTSIQEALQSKSWDCQSATLFYPFGREHNASLAAPLLEDGPKAQRAPQYTALARALAGSNADVGVISAEQFEFASPEILQTTLQKYLPYHANSARLIAYVRPHAERLVSSYIQKVKLGQFSGSLEAFSNTEGIKNTLFYADRFARWQDMFGARFELRAMIRTQLYESNVVADFLHFALNGAEVRLEATPDHNRAPSLDDLVLLRALHQHLGEGQTTRFLARRLLEVFATNPANARVEVAMDKRLYRQFSDRYAQDAQRLDDRFFAGMAMTKALEQAGETVVETAQSLLPQDHYSQQEQRRLSIWLSLLAAKIPDNPPLRQPNSVLPPRSRFGKRLDRLRALMSSRRDAN